MNDLDKLKELFDTWEVPYFLKDYESDVHLCIGVGLDFYSEYLDENASDEDCDDYEKKEAQYLQKVDGYNGFHSNYVFDANGKFKSIYIGE